MDNKSTDETDGAIFVDASDITIEEIVDGADENENEAMETSKEEVSFILFYT